ncbi:rab-protein geranylgeranyltransferase [Abortiporus biennis]|nr:rab-protein geranylgeranyltransferase [Abortiporus biennis]
MHGVKRIRYTQEALEALKQREKAKLKEFQALTEEVLTKKKAGDYSKDAFDSTTRLLRVNPEFYTIWNYRRNIMIHGIFPQCSPAEINDQLSEDLSMTTAFLKQHPKVYWIWNHRRWCLENVPDGPSEDDINGWRNANWNKELFVIDKMLEGDSRNFHAWDYRRYVLATMPVPRTELSELAFTTKKIEANFSNFSAWHQRSKLLSNLWESGKLDSSKSKEDEFELVLNAIYTDPEDQSAWIYHAWLIGNGNDASILNREIKAIQELLDEQPDSKWCMESLVRYKRMLLKNHGGSLSLDEKQRLHEECSSLLTQLQEVDPQRRRRYQEIAESLEH